MLSIINNTDKEKLIEKYKNIVFDDYYEYISSLNMGERNLADANNENHIEFISKKGSDIIGYFFARIDVCNPKIAHISNCFNLEKKEKVTFGNDLRHFINLLKKYGVEKLEWAVWEGNPAKNIYDKIKGVRYVGYYSNAVIHRGKEINLHLYELFLIQQVTDGEQ